MTSVAPQQRIAPGDLAAPVAVLAGGESAEREISLQSGAMVMSALRDLGLSAHLLDAAGRDLVTALQAQPWRCAFIALHGRGGEDGTVQACLEQLGIPYTGSGVLGSALAMDKWRSKQLWRQAGLATPAAVLLTGQSDWSGVVEQLGLPLMVKPTHEGSSLGMSKVGSVQALASAWKLAREYDPSVMAEAWVGGGEYTVALVGDQTLPVVKIEPQGGYYDYAAKYQRDDTRYLCPAPLTDAEQKQAGVLARSAFEALACSGWGRVDLLRDDQGDWQLIEVNTVPGLTSHSLVPKAARAHGWDESALIERILALALEAHQATGNGAGQAHG